MDNGDMADPMYVMAGQIAFLSGKIDRLRAKLAESEAERDAALSDRNDYWDKDRAILRAAEIRAEKAEALAKEQEEAKNGAYSERNRLVAALSKLFPSSVERHEGAEWEDDWRNVVFVDLPTGQVSWHIHDSEAAQFAHLPKNAGRKWDGHTTEQKYNRLAVLAQEPRKEGADG